MEEKSEGKPEEKFDCRIYEKAALKAAEILINKKCFPECWLTKRNGFFDQNGVDLMVILWSGLAVPIQIKVGTGDHIYTSLTRPSHGRLEQHFKIHKNIKIFIIVPKILVKRDTPESYELLADALRKAINHGISQTKEI